MEPEIPKCDLPVRAKPARKAKPAKRGKAKAPAPAPEVWDPKAEAAAARAAVAKKTRKGLIEAPEGAVVVPGISKRKRIPPPPTAIEVEPEAKRETKKERSARLRAEIKAEEVDPLDRARAALTASRAREMIPMNEEIFFDILMLIAQGQTLRQILRMPGMPSRPTFLKYVNCADEAQARLRFDRLARARALGLEEIAEEVLDIVDDGSNDWIEREHGESGPAVELDREHISRSKLRAETRLKLLAVWDPRLYGATLKHADADGGKLADRSLSASDLAIGLAKLVEAVKRKDLAIPASEAVIDQDPAA